jgi:hypothetical protein
MPPIPMSSEAQVVEDGDGGGVAVVVMVIA